MIWVHRLIEAIIFVNRNPSWKSGQLKIFINNIDKILKHETMNRWEISGRFLSETVFLPGQNSQNHQPNFDDTVPTSHLHIEHFKAFFPLRGFLRVHPSVFDIQLWTNRHVVLIRTLLSHWVWKLSPESWTTFHWSSVICAGCSPALVEVDTITQALCQRSCVDLFSD